MQLHLVSPTDTGDTPAAPAPAYLTAPLDEGQRALVQANLPVEFVAT